MGQVAARSGVAVSALHFYESQGLIRSWRNSGNQRRYAREVLRRVAVIKVAQRTGISLSSIREALEAYRTKAHPLLRTGGGCQLSGEQTWMIESPG